MTATDPLSVACSRCRAKAGEKCRNYLGKNKQTCPDRGATVQPKPAGEFVPDLLAGFDRPTAKADDFDDATPPPRTRPRGEPVSRFLELPPGEPVPELFAQWDKEGRIPPGCILALMTRSGYSLCATAPGVDLGVKVGKAIPADVLEPWLPGVTIRALARRFPDSSKCFVVYSLGKAGA